MMRALGWRPDPPQPKADWVAPRRLRATAIPKAASNRDLVRILDQGQLGSCTANAAAQCLRAAQLVAGAPASTEIASRLFLYRLALGAAGGLIADNGTYLRLIFQVANAVGFPPESVWPYDDGPEVFKRKPGETALRAAYDQRQPTEYRKITETGEDRLDMIRGALAARHLVCFGTDVTEDFCEGDSKPGVPVRVPSKSAKIAGGHALAIVGYDAAGNFDIANSWGTDFCDQGFFTMAPEYLKWSASSDFWIVEVAPIFSGGA